MVMDWGRRTLLRITTTTAATSLSLAALAGAAAAAPLTLADAVARALEDGPQARIARLEAGQATDEFGEARSVYLPHVGISSQAGYSNRQDEKLRAVDRAGRERTYGLASLGSDEGWFNFYVQQLLFDLSKWRQVERAALSAEAARIAEDERRETIALEVVRHYADVLRLRELVTLDEERLAAVARLDAQAAALLETGRVLDAERAEATLHRESLRLALEGRREALADARRTLGRLTGEEPGDGEAVTVVAESVPAVNALDPAAAEDALADAPELRVLDLRRRMEDLAVAAARAERYPTVGLQAGYSHYGTKRFDNFDDEVAVGVDVRIPLFDGYKARHSIAGAVKGAEIARLRYESAREAKRARVRELARQLVRARREPALAARRAELARERERLAGMRLRAARGTLAETLAAGAERERAAQAAIATRFDVVVLWATLQREVGRLATALLGAAAGDTAEGAS